MEVQVVVVTDSRVLNNKTQERRTRTVADGCVEWNADDADIELLLWVRQASHMREMGKGADAGEAELMWCQYDPLGLSEKMDEAYICTPFRLKVIEFFLRPCSRAGVVGRGQGEDGCEEGNDEKGSHGWGFAS